MSSSNPKVEPNDKPERSELQTKLKQKRQLMQRVRTNTCSMDTLQHISDMDPKLQMQALQQVKLKKSSASQDAKDSETKPKPKATTKSKAKTRARKSAKTSTAPTEPVEVTQSTADTNQSISEAKKQILMTALEKEVDRVAGGEDFGGLTPEFKTHAKNGLTMLKQMMKNPAFMEKISVQLSKWSQPGATPTPESISAFIQELIALIKAGVESSDKKTSQQPQFNHGPTQATNTTGTRAKIFGEGPNN